MTTTTPNRALCKSLDVEPKMVLEIASGLRPPIEIAADYGLSAEQWKALEKFEPFVKQVEAKKAELKASGWTFRVKSAMIAEELLSSLYTKATEEGASFHTALELAKFTARAAGLDAPVREVADTSSGFSITINLGGGQSVQIGGTQSMKTVEAEPEEEFDFTMAFEHYDPAPLPGDHHA